MKYYYTIKKSKLGFSGEIWTAETQGLPLVTPFFASEEDARESVAESTADGVRQEVRQ